MTFGEYLKMHPDQLPRVAKMLNVSDYFVQKWADGYGKPSRFQATMIMQFTNGRVPVKSWGFK